jgi:large subunit ribosomal protein L25
MASDRPNLEVAERTEFGSRTTRRLRREGLVPGVVYSGGSEARTFSVPEREARNLLSTGAPLFDLTFGGGKAEPVVVKEQQRHPVRGNVLHIDFQVVDLKQSIQSEVSIELLGADDSPGVKEGGVLEHITHSINVEALPTDIPESIAVDVSGMVITLPKSRSPRSTRRASRRSPRSRKRLSSWARTASRSRRPRAKRPRARPRKTPGIPATLAATTPTGSSPLVHLPPSP